MRRNGKLIAADIRVQIGRIRPVAQQEGLSPSSLDRIAKVERVVPKMQALSSLSRGMGGRRSVNWT
jgi:hypothetical protein